MFWEKYDGISKSARLYGQSFTLRLHHIEALVHTISYIPKYGATGLVLLSARVAWCLFSAFIVMTSHFSQSKAIEKIVKIPSPFVKL